MLRLCVTIFCIIVTQSCFTGIESTPTISDSEVRRQKIEKTPEDVYLQEVTPATFAQFTPGKQWIVLDSRIGKLMSTHGMGLRASHGDTLTLMNIKEVTSVTGEPQTDMYFRGPKDQVAVYRSSQSVDKLKQAEYIDIPFAVESSVVDQVSKIMTDHDYYITTATRYDLNNNLIRGRKFVKVHVDSITAGNDFYPISLYLSDGNDRFKLFMTVFSGSAMPRKFATLFSLSDPRAKYPSITDANWKNIINGRVISGMTKDECKLALGSPNSVERYPGYSVLREMWSYEDGKFLIFDDGILTSFRQ